MYSVVGGWMWVMVQHVMAAIAGRMQDAAAQHLGYSAPITSSYLHIHSTHARPMSNSSFERASR